MSTRRNCRINTGTDVISKHQLIMWWKPQVFKLNGLWVIKLQSTNRSDRVKMGRVGVRSGRSGGTSFLSENIKCSAQFCQCREKLVVQTNASSILRRMVVFASMSLYWFVFCSMLCDSLHFHRSATSTCRNWWPHWKFSLAPGRFEFGMSKSTSVPNFVPVDNFERFSP